MVMMSASNSCRTAVERSRKIVHVKSTGVELVSNIVDDNEAPFGSPKEVVLEKGVSAPGATGHESVSHGSDFDETSRDTEAPVGSRAGHRRGNGGRPGYRRDTRLGAGAAAARQLGYHLTSGGTPAGTPPTQRPNANRGATAAEAGAATTVGYKVGAGDNPGGHSRAPPCAHQPRHERGARLPCPAASLKSDIQNSNRGAASNNRDFKKGSTDGFLQGSRRSEP